MAVQSNPGPVQNNINSAYPIMQSKAQVPAANEWQNDCAGPAGTDGRPQAVRVRLELVKKAQITAAPEGVVPWGWGKLCPPP